jgi:hypothetical protein
MAPKAHLLPSAVRTRMWLLVLWSYVLRWFSTQQLSLFSQSDKIHSPAISSVTTFILSKVGDRETGGLWGWLFLDYCHIMYSCQGLHLSQCQHGVGCQGKPRGCDCPSQLWKIPLSYFRTLKPKKFYKCSSIGQLNITRRSEGLKIGVGQDAWKV